MSRLATVALAIAILLLAAMTSYLVIDDQRRQLPVLQDIGGNFSLPSTDNREVQLTDFAGKVVLLNFGFTSCPDVCPTVLSRMRSVMEILNGDSTEIQALFVTIDPERDVLSKLKTYLSFFHPSFVGLRGDAQQLKTVATLYKAVFEKETIDSSIDYGFRHSNHIYLIDQEGKTRAMYSGSAKPALIAQEISTLL